MGKSHKRANRAEQSFSEWLVLGSHWVAAVSGILVTLVTGLISSYISTGDSPKPNPILTTSLFYFVGGIILFGVVIVAIAGLLRRKNRDVITLKRRLSEIYLVAIRNSALNPKSHVTSHD
jgi:zinc transporter ZupT